MASAIALTRQDSMSSCASESEFRQDLHDEDDLGYEPTTPQQYDLRGPPPPHVRGPACGALQRSDSKYTDLNGGDDFSLAGECDNGSIRSTNQHRPGRRASLSAAIELTSVNHKRVPVKRNFSGSKSRVGRRNSMFGGGSSGDKHSNKDKHSSQGDAHEHDQDDRDDDAKFTHGWFPAQPEGKKPFRTRSGNILRRASMSSAAVEHIYGGQEPDPVNPQMFVKRKGPGRSKSSGSTPAPTMPRRSYSGGSGSGEEQNQLTSHKAPSRITRPKRGNRRASMSAVPVTAGADEDQKHDPHHDGPTPAATAGATRDFTLPNRSRSASYEDERPKFLQPHDTETTMYDLAVAAAAAQPQKRAGRRSSLSSFTPFARRRSSNGSSTAPPPPPPRSVSPARSQEDYVVPPASPLPTKSGNTAMLVMQPSPVVTPTTSNRKAVSNTLQHAPTLPSSLGGGGGGGGLTRLSMTPLRGSAIGFNPYCGALDDDSEEEEENETAKAVSNVSASTSDNNNNKDEAAGGADAAGNQDELGCKIQAEEVVEEVDVDHVMETMSQVDPGETEERELELEDLMAGDQDQGTAETQNTTHDPSLQLLPPSTNSNRESQLRKAFNILGHQSTGDWGRDVEEIMNINVARELVPYTFDEDDDHPKQQRQQDEHDYEISEEKESVFDDTQLYDEDYSEMAWKESQPRAFESMEFINMQNLLSNAKSTQGLYLPNFIPAHGCTNASDFIVRCFVARLRTGLTVTKHSRSRWGKSHERMLHILPSGYHITWIPLTEEEIEATKKPPTKLDLTKCLEVRHAWSQDPKSGKYTGTATLRAKCKEGTANRSFSLIFDKRSVDFTAYNVDQCKIMMEGFSALCFRLQMAKLEIQADDNESLISGVSGIDVDDDASSTASLTTTNVSSPWGL